MVPRVFWHLSIAGSLVILSYAIWRRDPVFILGQSTGLLVYVRNLVLIRRQENEPVGSPAPASGKLPMRARPLPAGQGAEIRTSALE